MGLRAAGKSTIAPALAARLGWDWIDTDVEVERAAGRTVRDIFTTDGEPAFRALERAALKAALTRSRVVVSLGGGAVESPENRELLRARCIGIWLDAAPEELLRRLQADRRSANLRPALTALEPLAEIRQLLATRSPLFEELAAGRIDTTNHSTHEVVEAALKLLTNSGQPSSQTC